jgi:tetratricopeptide (TPR) repeat protein
LDANLAPAHARLAHVYKQQGKISQAIEMYNKSLEIWPAYGNAHYNVAILHDIYMQDPAKAVTHLRKYLELNESQDKDAEIWLKQLERQMGVEP